MTTILGSYYDSISNATVDTGNLISLSGSGSIISLNYQNLVTNLGTFATTASLLTISTVLQYLIPILLLTSQFLLRSCSQHQLHQPLVDSE